MGEHKLIIRMNMHGWPCDFPLTFQCYNCGHDGKTYLKRRQNKVVLICFLAILIMSMFSLILTPGGGALILAMVIALPCAVCLCGIKLINTLKDSYHYCTACNKVLCI